MLIHTWWGRWEWERAKVAKTDKRRFTSSGLNVIWQSSILVNKWWGQGTETKTRSKTLINYFYLLNETTLISVSRSGRTWADLWAAFNIVGISLITKGTGSWFSRHRKPIVRPDHSSAAARTLHSRSSGKAKPEGRAEVGICKTWTNTHFQSTLNRNRSTHLESWMEEPVSSWPVAWRWPVFITSMLSD